MRKDRPKGVREDDDDGGEDDDDEDDDDDDEGANAPGNDGDVPSERVTKQSADKLVRCRRAKKPATLKWNLNIISRGLSVRLWRGMVEVPTPVQTYFNQILKDA